MKIYENILGQDYNKDLTQEQLDDLIIEKFNQSKNDITKLKEVITKSNSDASAWKKKYQTTLTEEEQKNSRQQEEILKIKEEYELLKKDKTINEHYTNFITLGYDEELAKNTAIAMYDNDFSVVFNNQKAFLKKQEEKYKAEIMKNNPIPQASLPRKITKEDFSKMSYTDMVKLSKESPQLYNELIKK